jgi:hypothetical protein
VFRFHRTSGEIEILKQFANTFFQKTFCLFHQVKIYIPPAAECQNALPGCYLPASAACAAANLATGTRFGEQLT